MNVRVNYHSISTGLAEGSRFEGLKQSERSQVDRRGEYENLGHASRVV